MKKLLLSALVLILSTTGIYAQCTASFTAALDTNTAYPYDMIFTNTSTPTVGTNFNWHFMGGASPAQENGVSFSYSPVVTYNAPGTYNVQLTVYDSLNACQDSIFTQVVIPGSVLACTTSVSTTQCGLCNGSASVIAAGGTAPYTYLWSNGATNDSLSGLCAGTYTVTVTDTFNFTSTCTVQVGNSTGMSLSMSASNNQPCPGETVTLTATPSGSAGYSYLWNIGTITASTTVNASGTYVCTVTDSGGCSIIDSIQVNYAPAVSLSFSSVDESCANCCDGSAVVMTAGGGGTLTYSWSNSSTNDSISSLCPGTYTVTVEDSLYGCTYIDSVTIAAFSACYAISGNVDQAILGDARVYLIEESNNVLTAVDSTITDSLGDYAFSNVCAGTYYIKAALLPSNTVYASFLPTYYNGALLWSNANGLVISNASMSNINVVMMSGNNPGGPGFVGGNISQGANSTSENPIRGGRSTISNLPFILTDLDNQLVAFTFSDENGDYSMDDLALGSYKLYVDYINKVSYPLSLTLTEENASLEQADFLLNEDDIRPVTPAGIANAFINKQAVVYPNPAMDQVTITSSSRINTLSVHSVDGKVILEENVNAERTMLDVSSFAQGSYIIQIQHTDHIEHHVLVKD